MGLLSACIHVIRLLGRANGSNHTVAGMLGGGAFRRPHRAESVSRHLLEDATMLCCPFDLVTMSLRVPIVVRAPRGRKWWSRASCASA